MCHGFQDMTSSSSISQTSTGSYFFPLIGLSQGHKNHQGRFEFTIDKELMGKRNIIYLLCDPDSRMSYVGKTNQLAIDRLRQHVNLLNNPSDDEGQSLMYTHFREHAMRLHFGVIDIDIDPDDDLEDHEARAIASIPYQCRLNSNSGRGGGTTIEAAQSAYNATFSSPQRNAQTPELKETPDKRYPFDGDLFQLTPGAKKAEAVVYSIKNLETAESYVGQTGREFRERSYEHCRKVRKSSASSKPYRLYEEMVKRPQNFAIGIHAVGVLNPIQRLELERKLIDTKQSDKTGYNRNKGGGGSVSYRFKKT